MDQKLNHQNLNQPPTGQNENQAGAIRPPLPNAVRPPVPMSRPPMPHPGQRPPLPSLNPPQQQGQRPPFPPGMRPPPPRPQTGNNPVRPPPMPLRPMSTLQSVPQSPSQNIINGFNNQPPSIPIQSPKLSMRPPTVPIPNSILSTGQITQIQEISAMNSNKLDPKMPQQAQAAPPMPQVQRHIQPQVSNISPPMPTRPPVGQELPQVSIRPPTEYSPRNNPIRPSPYYAGEPKHPAMPSQSPQSSSMRPIMPSQYSQVTNSGLSMSSQPPQVLIRPPMPMMTSPQTSAAHSRPPIPGMPFQSPPMPVPSARPPILGMPSVPGASQTALQRPPGPPIPQPQIRPPTSMSPSVGAPPRPMTIPQSPTQRMMPPMPSMPNIPQIPQIPTVPQVSTSSQMSNGQTGYNQINNSHQPQQAQEYPPQALQPQFHGYSQQPQGPPFQAPAQAQPQGFPQPQTSAHGYSQGHGFQQSSASYNSGLANGQPQPQSVTSSGHSLKEFYEEPNTFIKPNIKSDYFSCSLGKLPRNSSILGKARIPFGMTVSFFPFGDAEKDRVAEVSGPIVRCRRCRTYLNPFAELIEQGSRWRCNICFLANEFPPNYDFDQVTQTNIERKDHAEMKSFVYDFTNAPVEYTVRPPQPPVFFFALEVTSAAVQTGLFAASCRVIQEQLDSIPNEDGRARVALVTFDQKIQFYKITPNEPNARVLVVADAGEPFLPACSDLLVNLSECRSQLDALLDQLPEMYSNPSKSSPALGPVLQSAHLLLKSVGGKIVVISASLPTQFEGALKARDDQRLLGTPKESSLFQPANQFYKMFASEIVKDQICVDLFVAPPQLSVQVPIYVDLASLSGLAKYTGGKMYYYPEFGTGEAISTKFCSDLRRFLGQAHGFEAVLRIRASQGISLSAYHGSFFLRQTDLLSLPNVNPDHSFSAQASIDENLQGTVVCFQAALLHTTSRGERRIRVVNFSAPITEDVKEVFSAMNVNGIAGILTKMAIEKVLANRLEDAREAVLNKCSDVIATYKSQCGLKSNPNLLLPENMRNFAILLHALTKSIALRSGSQTLPDLRSFNLTLLKTLSAKEIIGLLLPRFYAIHSMESDVRRGEVFQIFLFVSVIFICSAVLVINYQNY